MITLVQVDGLVVAVHRRLPLLHGEEVLRLLPVDQAPVWVISTLDLTLMNTEKSRIFNIYDVFTFL